jgi:hypothetical protein
MFDGLLCSSQVCLLLIHFIRLNSIFALPNPHIANANDQQINANVFPSMSNGAWTQLNRNPGKDQLNAYHLRNARGNIIKSVFFIGGGVFILVIIGGIVSVFVYYAKKK